MLPQILDDQYGARLSLALWRRANDLVGRSGLGPKLLSPVTAQNFHLRP